MPSYTIARRRYCDSTESEKYAYIATVNSLGHADKIATSHNCEPGDIIIVCDTAYITDMPDHAESVYIAVDYGVTLLTPPPSCEIGQEKTWLGVWEGKLSSIDRLLCAADDFEQLRKSIIRCSLEFSKTLVHLIPKEDKAAIDALKITELYLEKDDVTEDFAIEMEEASRLASAAYSSSFMRKDKFEALMSCSFCYFTIVDAISNSKGLYAGTYVGTNIRSYNLYCQPLKEIISRYIPLRSILLATVGR